jgi:hypothetical protein
MLPVRPRCTHPPVGPLEGEPLRVPPSNASLPPLLGHLEVPCDQRAYPLGTPTASEKKPFPCSCGRCGEHAVPPRCQSLALTEFRMLTPSQKQ